MRREKTVPCKLAETQVAPEKA
uniref:Uncharacterized protein n=1 Tax=Arundo donax TaxID=35708 RepID=A0A0A9AS83_ARUDO